jgi:hypothetical protein
VANVHLTPADRATTAVEVPREDAEWLAGELERFDPSDTPEAADAAGRIRQATADPADSEVALSAAELDAVRRVFELNAPETEPLRQLHRELTQWEP